MTLIVFINLEERDVYLLWFVTKVSSFYVFFLTICCLLYCLGRSTCNNHQKIAEELIRCMRLPRGPAQVYILKPYYLIGYKIDLQKKIFLVNPTWLWTPIGEIG